ncbi:putative bifunctional diguanylate cyclase/phosphodiesterase [Thioalkalivibrio sulfidiphilus]|uniref:putative bifunctional diguanylate cyclase/phosphodiesterase n=1 Tax=Thioalkalivibrio sulfidiphilus TaxID=1033854 RepID=UPI00036FE152|nr:EAL domain-containing protein [Thioalkalivibrio sulfidiphilus]
MPVSDLKPRLHSLRARYTLFALFLVALVLISSTLAYLDLSRTQRSAAQDLELRDSLASSINGVRAGLVETYKSLDLFLIEAEMGNYQEDIHRALADTLHHATLLRESDWIPHHGQHEPVEAISSRLQQLHGEIDELIDIRLDPPRLYPSMAAGPAIMGPSRDVADNALGIIFYTMEQENTLVEDPHAYDALVRARRLWMHMLSNFRLYMANRLGSFELATMPVQEQGIRTLHAAFLEQFQVLELLAAEGRLGFEITAAMEDLRRGVEQWYGGFEYVAELHATDRWRTDAIVMREQVAPSVDAINAQLLRLERALATAMSADVQAIAAASSRLAFSLWLVAGLTILFVILLLTTTDRLVLRPIAAVTRALKAEAMGKSGVPMPFSRTVETRDLVEAFGEMHRQVRLREAELEYRALHDSLTTLPNRTLLLERIEHDMRLAHRQGGQLGLLMIDLDRFKEVNDTLGHQVGDALLVEVGNRLQTALRETDTVARLGGDEFAVLLPGAGREDVIQAAGKLQDVFKHPVQLNGMEIYVAASIGAAIYPDHGTQPQTLMQHADVAMYMAKRGQRGVALYDPAEDQYTIARLALMTDLRQAVEQGELTLHYQPVLSLATGELVSAEALLRWSHPEHGQVAPELVIELAEQTGLIGPLTYGVIDKALTQAARWRQQGLTLNISINLSMHNLHDADLTRRVNEALQQHGIPGECLTLEVTETAMMANPRRAQTALRELDNLGIRLAVDDFGTGFSSLSYLKSLPVDVLKIDKSFVMGLDRDKSDQAIVQATLSLGHSLGLEVVAEGVETRHTWSFLRDHGCDAAQGYHMSKPLPAEELQDWVKSRKFERPSTAASL